MVKILNKLFYILKNIFLPILLIATIYILSCMFHRLEKEIFGANFMEFLNVIAPYLLLLILIIVNIFFNHQNVKNNMFYNLTSLLVMLTIFIFCYRALFDQSMVLWYKYDYHINFNYFSDQIASIKVMLYGLSIANILLIIHSYIKDDIKEEPKEISKKRKVE